ncbi:MAG: histidine kinase [Bacteroidota bacterium]
MNSQHWFFRYKLHHIPFWVAYHFLWWTLRIGNPIDVLNSFLLPHAALKFIFYLVFQMTGVYFNLYYLIPRFLEKGRYAYYVSLLLLTIVVSASFIVGGYYFSAYISDKTFQELFNMDPARPFYIFESSALPSTAAAMTLAMSIKLTRNWIQAKRREKLLETEKLETELKFLKSQFNPHFLFNTINSIFVLINKNPQMASESLAKFSDLLRYQLYECNEHQIPLSQELGYLENFIALEKLRRDQNTEWNFQIENPIHNSLAIAPFILMPFVENAFKHLSQYKDKVNWVRINLYCEKHLLHFTVSNSKSALQNPTGGVKQYQGIGLHNVQRRLDLIYPGQHKLTISDNKEDYTVNLILNLN